jgi:hypothetical protein
MAIIIGIIVWEYFSEPEISSINEFNYDRKGWISDIRVCKPGTNECMHMRNTVSNATMY